MVGGYFIKFICFIRYSFIFITAQLMQIAILLIKFKLRRLTWLNSVGSKKALARLDGGHGGERYSWW